jgi:hypothetical protein
MTVRDSGSAAIPEKCDEIPDLSPSPLDRPLPLGEGRGEGSYIVERCCGFPHRILCDFNVCLMEGVTLTPSPEGRGDLSNVLFESAKSIGVPES